MRYGNKLNNTEAGPQKNHEAFKRDIAMPATGGTRDPVKANATFRRALKGWCSCSAVKQYPNCKTPNIIQVFAFRLRCTVWSQYLFGTRRLDDRDDKNGCCLVGPLPLFPLPERMKSLPLCKRPILRVQISPSCA